MVLYLRKAIINSQKSKIPFLQNGGFTLVELLCAVSIVAILAAVAVPMIGNWNKSKQLSGFARNLYGNMQLAKLEAVKNNCSVVVWFRDANSYEIFLDDGGPKGTGKADDDNQNGDERSVASLTTPGDVVIQVVGFSGTTTPGFTSWALPLKNRIGSVVLRRNGQTDRWYRVTLSPSGQLSLQKSTDSTNGEDGQWK